MSWLRKMVANQREGCFRCYILVPRQLAGKGVGMSKERAVLSDVHFLQVSFQTVLPQTKQGQRS
eukprot:35486-Amphidinium_carterae.1